jgi:hypothetical protein
MQLILNNEEIIDVTSDEVILYVNEEDRDNFYDKVSVANFSAILDMPYWWFHLSAIGVNGEVYKLTEIKEIK